MQAISKEWQRGFYFLQQEHPEFISRETDPSIYFIKLDMNNGNTLKFYIHINEPLYLYLHFPRPFSHQTFFCHSEERDRY